MAFVTHRVDGVLGDWTAVEWRPARLRGAAERLWHFRGRVAHPRERVLPDGRYHLIVHLRGRYGIVERDGVARCAVAGVGGLQTRAFVIEAPAGASCVLGVELTPAGAWRVLGRPLHEITAADVDLADLAGAAATAALRERCDATAEDAEACLGAAAAWIEARLAGTHATAIDPAVSWVAAQIRGCRGDVRIASLRARTGLSTARLATRFREQIGVTPKVYARLERFGHAAACLRRGDAPGDVAVASGYYDQPHLTAEFRELSGLTPAAFAEGPRYETGVNVPEA